MWAFSKIYTRNAHVGKKHWAATPNFIFELRKNKRNSTKITQFDMINIQKQHNVPTTIKMTLKIYAPKEK